MGGEILFHPLFLVSSLPVEVFSAGGMTIWLFLPLFSKVPPWGGEDSFSFFLSLCWQVGRTGDFLSPPNSFPRREGGGLPPPPSFFWPPTGGLGTILRNGFLPLPSIFLNYRGTEGLSSLLLSRRKSDSFSWRVGFHFPFLPLLSFPPPPPPSRRADATAPRRTSFVPSFFLPDFLLFPFPLSPQN